MKKVYFYDDDKINNWNVKNSMLLGGGPFISEKKKEQLRKK